MQSYLAIGILVLFGQLTGDRYAPPPAESTETIPETTPEANTETTVESSVGDEPWDISPVTPRDAVAPPAEDGSSVMDSEQLDGPETSPAEQPAAILPAEPPVQPQDTRPVDLLQEFSRPPISGRLAGEMVTLVDAVGSVGSRAEQTAIIEAYWNLSTALTDYYLSARESTELETLRQSVSQPGPAWQEARRALTARMQLARHTAEIAQHRLYRLMRSSPLSGLPLPVDVPHTGAYATRYDENFSGRESGVSRELHQLVPSLHEILNLQAALITADQQWLETVSRQRNPQSNGTLLLKTYELVSLRRREFVRTVCDYNRQIVRYTELATPGQVGTERVVAMLIENPSASTLVHTDAAVATASAEEPVGNSADLGRPPNTFAEEGRATHRPAAPGTPDGEHSIVVGPNGR